MLLAIGYIPQKHLFIRFLIGHFGGLSEVQPVAWEFCGKPFWSDQDMAVA
jgi:hypothetical protein